MNPNRSLFLQTQQDSISHGDSEGTFGSKYIKRYHNRRRHSCLSTESLVSLFFFSSSQKFVLPDLYRSSVWSRQGKKSSISFCSFGNARPCGLYHSFSMSLKKRCNSNETSTGAKRRKWQPIFQRQRIGQSVPSVALFLAGETFRYNFYAIKQWDNSCLCLNKCRVMICE